VSDTNKGKEGDVARYRFDIALQNALRRARSGEARSPKSEFAAAALAPIARSRNVLAQIARPLVRPFARRVRQYLIGQTELVLEILRNKLDLQLGSLQQKVDEADQRLNTMAGQLQAVGRQLQGVGRQLETLTSIAPGLTRRLDDVSIHVRGPIRVDDATFAVRTGDGYVFVPDTDTQLLLLLMDAGPEGLEPGTRRAIQTLLRPGGRFVDVGAHIGLLSLAAARTVGPRGKVIAIEPTPLTSSLLARAAVINGVSDRVQVHVKAAGARTGRIAFFVHPVLGHNTMYEISAGGERIEVDVLPLDDLVPAGERVDLIKIDVEGAELEVLQGMTRILSENPCLSVIAEFAPAHLDRSKRAAADWLGAFAAKGFAAAAIDELTGALTPLRAGTAPDGESTNILFSRNGT
jgi:FkbM family methyltransferase